ncbi:MAG: septum formation initiator family protein [Actinomycetota bacterium]
MAGKSPKRLPLRTLLLLAAAAAILFLTIAPAREVLRQRTEIEELSEELDSVKTQNSELHLETQRLNTDAYIEQQARERLGLIKPGEEPFLLVPPKQEPPKPATKPAAKPKAKPVSKTWWQQIIAYFEALVS